MSWNGAILASAESTLPFQADDDLLAKIIALTTEAMVAAEAASQLPNPQEDAAA